ncbi:MAG TPA: L-threonylcarbamoyladenylate synthase [Kofleriaceae bacterium]|nr:L-threonylcarbamoyladenylate synthase [Kofleriaceae bacterium]
MSEPLRLPIDPWGDPPARKIRKVVEILHGGGVAAYPTDSVYALGCAIEAREAIERIHRARGMHKNQRLALICPDLSTAAQYGRFNQVAFRLAQKIFPGPYTLVVPATHEVPRTLTDAKRRTVGIRVTSHPIAQAIVAALGRPLLTSSAIPPGSDAPCRDADEILEHFGHHVDVVIDTTATEDQPSTVLEVDGDEVNVLRLGQGPIEGLL